MAHCTFPARRDSYVYGTHQSRASSPIVHSRLTAYFLRVNYPSSRKTGSSTDGASRGSTRTETLLSEADSYVHLAQAHDYWGFLPSSRHRERVVIERRALD